MSTPNFITQRGFPLMVLDDSEYVFPVCPECGCWMEEIGEGRWGCTMCEYTTSDPESDCKYEFDQPTYDEDVKFIEDNLEKFNAGLTFLKVKVRSGYYTGVQTIVECPDNPCNLENSECRYLWDMCRSKAIRKFESEKRRVAKFLKELRHSGLVELVLVGIFSNGEAVYRYAN